MTHRRAVLILLGCTFVWGASFTLNKMVLGQASPLLFMATRFAISCLFLGAIYRRTVRSDWKVGLPLGMLFALQLSLFVLGLSRIEPARSAFLFSFQTPLVPVLTLLAHRLPPSRRDLIAVGLATVGAWWLTRPSGAMTGLGWGDVLTIGSAGCAALYVVLASTVGSRHDSIQLLAVQFVAMTVFAGVGALTIERPHLALNATTLTLIPFLALTSIATFGGQLLGQKLIRPTEAALVFALEPLFAALVSYVSIGERLSTTQWVGGLTILAASFLAQWQPNRPTVEPNPI